MLTIWEIFEQEVLYDLKTEMLTKHGQRLAASSRSIPRRPFGPNPSMPHGVACLSVVNSLGGVGPAAPQASVQSRHVELELGEAEVADHPPVETLVAATRRRKDLS